MSESARQFQPQDNGGRPAPGPLRDWLAAMKAATAQAEALPEPVKPRPDAPAQAWSPRVVTPPAETPAVDADVSDLMAENLMLKAKLRLETDRYGELQAMLAHELRSLRAHVEEEMAELEEVRAERDLWMARAEALAQPLFQKR